MWLIWILLQYEIQVIKLGHLTLFFFTCLRKGKRGEEPPPKETKRGPLIIEPEIFILVGNNFTFSMILDQLIIHPYCINVFHSKLCRSKVKKLCH